MKTIAIAGGLLASTLLLAGCGLGSLAGPNNEDTVSYEVTDKVATLRLVSRSGDAVVTETGGGGIRVVETLHWRGDDKPQPEHRVNGQELFVTYDCPSEWGSCSVDYKIEVPKGLRLNLEAGSGNLTLRDSTGEIDLNAGSGDVDAAGLAGKKLNAELGSGNIELKYAAAPEDVRLKTGSGDISLHVPDQAYAVDSEVGSGDLALDVKQDKGAPNKISVTAGSGDIAVSPS
ncbi:DUF4097 family beta strand repeat-containing protein [Nonomuraea sp. NPDC004580]|uniref:DUF4097 family beta strand repeat-containing protein n=1 Tax=Nonomuraea sp. NPDC004580 TaxID=3154552 RepID=UPI0033B4E293